MNTVIIRLLVLLFSMLSYTLSFSYVFIFDNIYYNLSPNEDYVEVTYKEPLVPSYSGNVTIPEKITFAGKDYPVKVIGENAFYCCENLLSINLPESIDTIGNSAFFYCKQLEHIDLPSKLVAIKNSAFSNCYKLSNISLPESIEIVEGYVFYRDSCLVNPIYNSHLFAYMPPTISGDYVVPNGIKKITTEAFSNCKLLKRIEIPESVEKIESMAFSNCENLEEVNLTNQMSCIDAGLFANCKALQHVDIPQSISIIDNGAFRGCTNLTNLDLPKGINEIGSSAFYGCTALESLILPSNLKSLKRDLFYGCSKLSKVVLPDGLKEIYAGVFYDCQNLKEINFPSSIEYIEQETDYYVKAPFENCKSLNTPLYNSNVFAFMPQDFKGEFKIIEGTKYIGCGAFLKCGNLESIEIPETVVSIGYGAFKSCYGLREVNIPKNIEKIYGETFFYCLSLDSITIPEKVTSLGYMAFNMCESLKSVKIYANEPPRCEELAINPNTIQTLYVPYGSIEEYSSQTPWCKIQNIVALKDSPEHSFIAGSYCWKAIDYDDEVDFKAELEFSPNYKGDMEIPAYFAYNSKTYKVVSIGDNAFYKNYNITSVSLPNTLENIGNQAFLNCYELTGIDIPEKVTHIGSRAFSGTRLYTINLPDEINYLEYGLFCDCTSLMSVHLPLKLKKIPGGLCWRCPKLDNIEIPQFVDTIGSSAFSECYLLKRVRVNSSIPPVCDDGVFNFTPIGTDCILEVPKGTKNIYSETFPWKNFYEIIEFSDTDNLPESLQAIDLGLSVDWANINLGALTPESSGDYYAWAETKTKDEFNINNSISYNVEFLDISGTSYDAATCNWGNGWRMPTNEELNELFNKCRWVWSTANGTYGYYVYGSNSNYIFIPASGIKQGKVFICSNDREGAIWTSSPIKGNNVSSSAYHFYNGPDGWFSYSHGNRYLGYCIRPVKDKPEPNSISTIYIDDSNDYPIYNTMGVKVGKSLNDLEKMSSGIYIFKGKKILKK